MGERGEGKRLGVMLKEWRRKGYKGRYGRYEKEERRRENNFVDEDVGANG